MPANCNYVVLSNTGKVIPIQKGNETNYFNLLLELAATYKNALEGHVIPRALLCDGEIVQANGLLSTALAYHNERATAIALAEEAVRLTHRPAWLSE